MSDALKGITVFDERTCPWCGRRSHAGDCLPDDMRRYVEQLQHERDKLREVLEDALDAWAAKLCMMPNIRERERFDAARNVLDGGQDD